MKQIKKSLTELLDFSMFLGRSQFAAFSANAAFFIILSIFPIIMLLLSLVKISPYGESDFMELILKYSPDFLSPLLTTVTQELYRETSVTFLSISGIAALWSASRGMLGIMTGLNAVYGVKENRSYLIRRIIAIFYMLFFITATLGLLILHVVWAFLTALIEARIPTDFTIPDFFTRYVLIFVILAALFTIMYEVFPNRKAPFIKQLPGGVTAALGWVVFTYLFGLYVNNYSNYSLLYGSLTTFIVVMLWVYFCMLIFFIGGALNAYLERYST